MLTDKPKDPVPFIYSYFLDMQRGVNPPQPLNDNEINEIKNLKKKVDYLKDQLNNEDHHSEHSDDEEEEEVADVQPKKKNIKAQRAGVSAEVYG